MGGTGSVGRGKGEEGKILYEERGGRDVVGEGKRHRGKGYERNG